MKRIGVVAAMFALATMVGSVNAATYDAFTDFSTASNPNGVWTYGWEPTLGGAFTVYDQSFTGPISGWRSSTVQSLGAPVDAVNATTALFHPGNTNQVDSNPNLFSIFRFTAPSAGSYSLSSSFAPGDSTTTDVHVLNNDLSIFDGTVTSTTSANFDAVLLLSAGDRIDFAVGNGGNGFFNDTTVLAATLSTSDVTGVPEPGALLLLGSAMLGLSGAVWRRRRG